MRQTTVVSVSLPRLQVKRLGHLARMAGKAKSAIVQEALESYQLKSRATSAASEAAWEELEAIGRSLSPALKKGALHRALLLDRQS